MPVATRSTAPQPRTTRSGAILRAPQSATPPPNHSTTTTNTTTNDNDSEDDDEEETYTFEDVTYTSYSDMVAAKRRRNQRRLQASGLLSLEASLAGTKTHKPSAARQKRRSTSSQIQIVQQPPRKSSRLQGVPADGRFVDEERAGKFVVVTGNSNDTSAVSLPEEQPQHYRNRINDGEPISIRHAVVGHRHNNHSISKGIEPADNDLSVDRTEQWFRNVLQKGTMETGSCTENITTTTSSNHSGTKKNSPTSVMAASSSRIMVGAPHSSSTTTRHPEPDDENEMALLEALSVDTDSSDSVAKVCPDRIYSVAVHPRAEDILVAAGDKTGHVGLWHATSSSPSNNNNADDNGVYQFRPHTGPVSCLEWTASGLFSASYDGTCRWWDVETGQFREIFATYNDNAELYQSQPGFGLDTGKLFWTQFACLDHSSHGGNSCLLLSTSVGTAMHVDWRTSRGITWHEKLSEKKINTLSLHPNGYALISAGLDCTVNLWDVRRLGDNRKLLGTTARTITPIAHYNGGRSVNSAFFSASGKYVVSTTMANKLDFFADFHMAAVTTNDNSSHPNKRPKTTSSPTTSRIIQPLHSIRHDNQTGRWLTTFQAIAHPHRDHLFAVGSMQQPRCVEIWNAATGHKCRAIPGYTAVASRLAFHPAEHRFVLVGGNSSGRVTVVQS